MTSCCVACCGCLRQRRMVSSDVMLRRVLWLFTSEEDGE